MSYIVRFHLVTMLIMFFVNSIGRVLEFMRYKVIYYEDFPYVSDSSMVSYMGKTKELKNVSRGT